MHNNVQTSCATLLCCACGNWTACVAVRIQLERWRWRNGQTHWSAPTEDEQYSRSPCESQFSDFRRALPKETGVKRVETAVFQKQFPFNYTKSSKVEQKYSISPLKCLQSVILKSEVSIMQCKGSTKSTVSGRFKIIVAEISGVICGVKIQVAAAANMKWHYFNEIDVIFRWSRPYI